MVEVFKTNVIDALSAKQLINLIRNHFKGYLANFDLDDCDRILRVENKETTVEADSIIDLLQMHGYQAEVLADDLEITL
jgi:hypothetical protein